jgi:pimeloyl-ACP methyl ester carboxylesterase
MTKRLTWLTASQADRLLASGVGRTVMGAQYYAHPARISAVDMAADVRAVAAAPWFDETLAAITNEPFGGGEQIAVPVTIAWGEHDRLLLPRQARRAQAAIPSARVITLRGCGHIPMPDDRGQVTSVLLEASAQPAASGP